MLRRGLLRRIPAEPRGELRQPAAGPCGKPRSGSRVATPAATPAAALFSGRTLLLELSGAGDPELGRGHRRARHATLRVPVTAPVPLLSRRQSSGSCEAVPRSHSNLGALRNASEGCFRVRELQKKTDFPQKEENATETKKPCGAPAEIETTEADGSQASHGTDRTGAGTTSREELRTRETRHDPGGSWLSKVRSLLGTRGAQYSTGTEDGTKGGWGPGGEKKEGTAALGKIDSVNTEDCTTIVKPLHEHRGTPHLPTLLALSQSAVEY
ncbi:hypothetical protein NDU88_003617 [Pleurodeles waltl]|uniref:Uncharacterized protein n=1 Tax=Pleurodeles waltl TaxID=8319 RepID=A0AAV7TQ45_PLEWA|nr:hypothetical protein NDU88_003617 [Pleurodeles waltl]